MGLVLTRMPDDYVDIYHGKELVVSIKLLKTSPSIAKLYFEANSDYRISRREAEPGQGNETKGSPVPKIDPKSGLEIKVSKELKQ